MISSIRHKQSISWTFSNDAMAISAKEMPKNHTDKERFAAASSCIEKGILTLLFPRKRRRSSPSPFISHRVLDAVASRILKSLLKDFHEKAHHQGRGFTLNEIRSSGYWIIGCSGAVSSFIKNCVTCQRLRAKVQEQKMAEIPKERVEPSPPFTYCGVDLFGPWYVKEGRK